MNELFNHIIHYVLRNAADFICLFNIIADSANTHSIPEKMS